MNRADIAIVAGSGMDLGGILDVVETVIPFDTVPGLGSATVAGHAGAFIFGRACGRRIAVQQGRRHFYEGLTYADVVRPVELLADAGVRTMLFTNAAGGLRRAFAPGDLMAISRIRCLPTPGWTTPPPWLRPELVLPGCDHRGVYASVPGPCYETPAEIMALRRLRIAAAGMSTAAEVDCCQRHGLRCGAVSCITNTCFGDKPVTHDCVLEAARRCSARLRGLLREALQAGLFD